MTIYRRACSLHSVGTADRRCSHPLSPLFSNTHTHTHQDIVERDLRDEPYLIMEHDAAKLQPPDDSGGLELHQASRRGELDKVKRLTEEKKLNPLQKDKNNNTALHLAALGGHLNVCLLYTSPSPRDATLSRMPSSA